jgi:putative flippase GtrA
VGIAMTDSTSARSRLPRFLVVGAWNTAVGYAIFVALALAFPALHHQVILAIAFAISAVHAYAMQRYFVFRSANPMAGEFARFVAVNLVALALNAVFLEVLTRAGLPVLLAQAVAVVATTVVQFVLHQAWSFRARP